MIIIIIAIIILPLSPSLRTQDTKPVQRERRLERNGVMLNINEGRYMLMYIINFNYFCLLLAMISI